MNAILLSSQMQPAPGLSWRIMVVVGVLLLLVGGGCREKSQSDGGAPTERGTDDGGIVAKTPDRLVSLSVPSTWTANAGSQQVPYSVLYLSREITDSYSSDPPPQSVEVGTDSGEWADFAIYSAPIAGPIAEQVESWRALDPELFEEAYHEALEIDVVTVNETACMRFRFRGARGWPPDARRHVIVCARGPRSVLLTMDWYSPDSSRREAFERELLGLLLKVNLGG